MDVIKGILIILMVVASDISFYYWGRGDGLERGQQIICEVFLEKLKEREKDDETD